MGDTTKKPSRAPGTVTLRINGIDATVPLGTTVAVAVARAGRDACRESVSFQRRGPVCGMGICGECRVTIDDQPHQRGCLILCRDGMEVKTDV